MPCLFASLDYIQTMYLTEIPSAQCVSLQRDVFGRHGFERLDQDTLRQRTEGQGFPPSKRRCDCMCRFGILTGLSVSIFGNMAK